MKHILILLILILIVLGVSGCTNSSPINTQPTNAPISPVTVQKTIATTIPTPIPLPSAEQTSTVSDNTVLIKKDAFDPQVITVKTGAIVRWQNTDDSTHRIQFVNKNFSTFLLSAGESFSQKFDRPGVYDYSDMINPSLRGTVRVE